MQRNTNNNNNRNEPRVISMQNPLAQSQQSNNEPYAKSVLTSFTLSFPLPSTRQGLASRMNDPLPGLNKQGFQNIINMAFRNNFDMKSHLPSQ